MKMQKVGTPASAVLRAIVDDYIRCYRDQARTETDEFAKLSSLRKAIRHAALCHWLPSMKKHPHQHRLPTRLLLAAERSLQRASEELASAPSFADLHRVVGRKIGSMRGIGALAVYDISHRIGAYLGKAPELVYLHRGTRIGAAHLGLKGDALEPRCFPRAFERLSPAEIEDCLCINAARMSG